MRTLISAFAGLALLAGVSSSVRGAAPDVQTTQPQGIIAFTAGQGGGMVFSLTRANAHQVAAGPTQAVAVTAGQGGSITIVVPGPSVDVVAKSPGAQPDNGTQVTQLPTN